MSPKQLGKSVTPFRKPDIGAAKDPRLKPITTGPLVPPMDLSLSPDDVPLSLDVSLEDILPFDFEEVSLQVPRQTAAEAQIRMAGFLVSALDKFRPQTPQGCLFQDPIGTFVPGAPRLPRSYRLVRSGDGVQAADAPGELELLRPILEPSAVSSELSSLILPTPLRADQIEAVNALLANEAFLLADDLGTGKASVAFVALTTLIQRGVVRRALYICPTSTLRTTARLIQTWAPGLLVTAVHGNRAMRKLDWTIPAHIYLTTYETLNADIEAGILEESQLNFDLVIVDGVHPAGLRFQGFPGQLIHIEAERRWVLAGALPVETEDWLALFRFLLPAEAESASGITLPDVRRRFRPYILRRTKEDIASTLPHKQRLEIWLDLDQPQMKDYEETLAEERHQLAKLGRSVTQAHIYGAIERIQAAYNFSKDSLDSAKSRALVDLVEQIAAADAKVIVFSQHREAGLDRLQPLLEPYGLLRLDTEIGGERRQKILRAFRDQRHWHVLLIEMGTSTGGEPLVEATYIIHFDQDWNPAKRLRAEARLYPEVFSAVPLNVYELWVANTIDENLHRVIAERNLMPSDLPQGTQPNELESRITMDDWLRSILEVPMGEQPTRVEREPTKGTGVLPGTAVLRSRLSELSPDTLLAAVETLIKALGYPETEPLDEPDEEGGYLLAWREEDEVIERVLVRCIRTHENVGVAKARALLKAMETRRDCVGAYLVATSDYTASCKKFADDSEGQLALVSGAELYRHLHILGRV